MVNSLSHAGIGLLIALFMGLRGKESRLVILFSVLPDLDFIPYAIFLLLENSLSYEMRNQLFYLMGHREFMHSILFLMVVLLILFLFLKNSHLIIACALAILSHVYLDYATTWKMRPFFPLIKESSTLGAFDFFDPLVTVISLVPLFMIILEFMYQRNKGKWIKMEHINRYLQQNSKNIIFSLTCLFVVWCALAPFSKLMLVDHVSAAEGHKISYQDATPLSFGKFLGAYSFNETHYKIFEMSYWNSIEKYNFVPKKSYDNLIIGDSIYLSRAATLYNSSLPREIDYPVYNITENSTTAIVTISDARSAYVKYWAYFRVQYTFLFQKENNTYVAFMNNQLGEKSPVPSNRFIGI